ncbi:hypothetical protein [Methanobrevibacter sp.]|uniref:hypothetical protein n=1 Tax=Methanobrevibacter sp. TaxID=66852 RepID=UPI00388DE0B1
MAEKRFSYSLYEDGSESIYDHEDDEYYFNNDMEDIGNLLNDLSDEKAQLNEENKKLREWLYESESIIIGEYSSHIKEDMEKLNEVINGSIEDLEKFIKR